VENEIAPATSQEVRHQRRDLRATVFMAVKHHAGDETSREAAARPRRFPADLLVLKARKYA
jgi:hypothetical protein